MMLVWLQLPSKKRLYERNITTKFDHVTKLKDLSKQEYREFCHHRYYAMPEDNSSAYFWHFKHEKIYKQVYAPMSTKVCLVKYIDNDLLFKDEYFCDALWVTEKMGLHKLMVIKENYSPRMVQQFFATLEFDNRGNIGFTWMTNDVRKFSNFARFGQLLGYDFHGLESPNGHSLHLDTSEYNKKKMTPLYAPRGKPGDTSTLLPIYDILLQMFRANISPSGGNNDAI
jgi:hypothetical protein